MEKVWYYMKPDRSKYGPYSDDELAALIRQEILEMLTPMEQYLH